MMWILLILAFFIFSFLSYLINKRLYKDSVEVEDYSVDQYYVKEQGRFKWNGLIFLVTFILIYLGLVKFAGLNFDPYLVSSLSLLFLIGVLSDLFKLTSFIKLILVLGVSALMVKGGIYISSLGGILGFMELEGSQLWFFNIFLITFLINALKQMNAVVGMSIAFTFVNAGILAIFFKEMGPHVHWVLSFLVILCLVAYIVRNFYQAGNQFGNSGSLVLAGILIYLSFVCYQTSRPLLAEKGIMNILPMIYSLFIVPVYDTIRVMIWRMYIGHSPFRPDQRHFLSLLNMGGYNPTKAMVRIFMIHIVMVALGVWLSTTTLYLGYSLLIITGAQVLLVEYYSFFEYTRKDNEDIMDALK